MSPNDTNDGPVVVVVGAGLEVVVAAEASVVGSMTVPPGGAVDPGSGLAEVVTDVSPAHAANTSSQTANADPVGLGISIQPYRTREEGMGADRSG